MTVLDLGLDEHEHQYVMTAPLTSDWMGSPLWYSAFRKWAEATGESHGLWLGDLYYIQSQIDVEKEGASTELWRDYLLYLPTDGSVPESAMADVEKLAQGQEIDRSVDELLNEMAPFMIETVTATLIHTYVFGPFSEAIAEYKAAYGGGGEAEAIESEDESGLGGADDGHYGTSPLPDDGHYGTSPLPDDEHTYDTYPGSGQTPAAELAPIDQVLDFDTLQEENQRALKEAQDPGTRLPFWQLGSWLLIGPGHDAAAYQHLLDRGAVSGWVTVVSRGSTLRRDPGLFQVQGTNDPDAFSETVGRFSNKRVEFV